MRVEGQEIPVSGSLLQPRASRTTDLIRVGASLTVLGAVVAGSEVTRGEWHALEESVSGIVGVLTPAQANLVFLLYGLVIMALPFAILIGVLAGLQWRLVAAFFVAGTVAGLLLSITPEGLTASGLTFESAAQLDSFLSQFLIDSRWIAGLAAVLTVSGPWLPKLWRRWWWGLLLAFIPIHLVASTVLPARSVLGLAVGWCVGSLTVLIVGTPALEVPLRTAARELMRQGHKTELFTVLRPAGAGPLILSATGTTLNASPAGDSPAPAAPASGDAANEFTRDADVIVELYGPSQRSNRALRQYWRWLSLRENESAPLHASMRRATEHRALISLVVDDVGLASSRPLLVSALDRGWVLYARTPARGRPIQSSDGEVAARNVWQSLRALHAHQISHGDLRADQIRTYQGAVLFGGFGAAEYGAPRPQLLSDIAQLLLTTTALFGQETAVRHAVEAMGEDEVLAASGRLTRAAIPARLRRSVPDCGSVLVAAREEVLRQTGADRIKPEQVTRFTRNQLIQLALLIALVYVAYPFISAVPTFYDRLRTVNWTWALLGLAISALTYVGAAAALWACANGVVSFRNLTIMQLANTFAATTTPAGVGGLALSVRFLQKGGLGVVHATAAVTLQQSVQVITHVGLLVFFAFVAGTTAQISQIVPDPTVVYLVVGIALGIFGVSMLVPALRRWLGHSILPQLRDVARELGDLARDPQRFSIILLGCAMTTLGMALALWASIEAFGGGTTFVSVTVVTMIGGTLASAAPTPGGVGAVEAVLIGGLVAFGVPAATAVPAVLLYRVLTTWLPVALGWPTLRWLGAKDMI
ncbi:lysylphosphatidylglycerol synthase transmembrane domain-containing protein [Hoyosella altamirensis]|uniref:Uncharacterized membrane protein YbhN (UPF0104 family) n=1 Tax=Hoyosella altamirensis TaxID=616997 RepID=A0A839RS79_9ACTN|nr:lysylphosphatidylglycerol synthase transmembrane domain-containing protein [Hoyosella altamirensis]MBB3039715.1 uncharacterized membrane protein YbhN (UPF0104 family) [Hoyosella altamirensis]